MARPLACSTLAATDDISTVAAKKVALNAGATSYIIESAANNVDIYVSGVIQAKFRTDIVRFPQAYNATTGSAANVWVDTDGQLARSTSSLRFKHDVATLAPDHAKRVILSLRPVTYRPITDKDQRRYAGFIAEEVAVADPLLATYDEGGESGTPNYVTYDRITAYLVSVVQQLEARVAALEGR